MAFEIEGGKMPSCRRRATDRNGAANSLGCAQGSWINRRYRRVARSQGAGQEEGKAIHNLRLWITKIIKFYLVPNLEIVLLGKHYESSNGPGG